MLLWQAVCHRCEKVNKTPCVCSLSYLAFFLMCKTEGHIAVKSAVVEALKKWDGGCAPVDGGIVPFVFIGIWGVTRKIFENVGANM